MKGKKITHRLITASVVAKLFKVAAMSSSISNVPDISSSPGNLEENICFIESWDISYWFWQLDYWGVCSSNCWTKLELRLPEEDVSEN